MLNLLLFHFSFSKLVQLFYFRRHTARTILEIMVNETVLSEDNVSGWLIPMTDLYKWFPLEILNFINTGEGGGKALDFDLAFIAVAKGLGGNQNNFLNF